jgi:hypothetical protein
LLAPAFRVQALGDNGGAVACVVIELPDAAEIRPWRGHLCQGLADEERSCDEQQR